MLYFHTEFYIIILLFGTTLSLENEPKCYSRYDYEEKLMEKTVENNFQMKQIMEKFDTTLKELEATKADFDSANAHLQSLIEGVKENISNDIQERLQMAIASSRQPVILFNVRILKDKQPARGSRLVYTTIGQNTGDAFNQDTGTFTAPVNGTYLFSAQISTPTQKWGAVQIVVNGAAVQSIVQYMHAGSGSSTSGTTVQRLKKGDEIWVQQDPSWTSYYYDYEDYSWNYFSGVLLHL